MESIYLLVGQSSFHRSWPDIFFFFFLLQISTQDKMKQAIPGVLFVKTTITIATYRQLNFEGGFSANFINTWLMSSSETIIGMFFLWDEGLISIIY